jgi:lipopolysaccharide transport system permease protein
VPERWRSIYSLNPLVGLIEGFRAVLLNRALNLNALLFSTVITIPLVIYALFVFRRMERDFADVV